jgi:hypothetical protein
MLVVFAGDIGDALVILVARAENTDILTSIARIA